MPTFFHAYAGPSIIIPPAGKYTADAVYRHAQTNFLIQVFIPHTKVGQMTGNSKKKAEKQTLTSIFPLSEIYK